MHAAASPCKAAPSSGSALRASLRWATGSPRMMHRRVPPARVPTAIRDLLNPPAADTLGMGAYRRHTSCSDAARGWIKAARAGQARPQPGLLQIRTLPQPGLLQIHHSLQLVIAKKQCRAPGRGFGAHRACRASWGWYRQHVLFAQDVLDQAGVLQRCRASPIRRRLVNLRAGVAA